MNAIVLWAEIISVIAPFYPSLKNHPKGGRPAYELEVMLRIYFLQNRFGDLLDPEPEEAFYSLFFNFPKQIGKDLFPTKPQFVNSDVCLKSIS